MLLTLGILIGFCSVAIIAAGLLAFLRNGEKSENKHFLALCIALGLWVVANFVDSSLNLSQSLASIVVKLDFSIALFIGWSLLQFVVRLTRGINEKIKWINFLTSKKFRQISLIVNLIFLCGIFLNHVFVVKVSTAGLIVEPKEFFIVYVIAVCSYILVALQILASSYVRSSQTGRRKLALIVIGFIAASIVNIFTNLVFPNIIEQRAVVEGLNIFGYLGIFLLVLCMYLAITTRKLFDIKSVIVRSLTYFVLATIITVFYLVIVTLIGQKIFSGKYIDASAIAVSITIPLLILITFRFLRSIFDKVTNKLFFHDAYETQDVIGQLNAITSSTTELNKILDYTRRLLENSLKSTFCTIILVNKDGKIVHIRTDQANIDEKANILVKAFSKSFDPIITELIDEESTVHKILERSSAELVYPLYANNALLGIIIFGTKQNGMVYVQKDLGLVKIVAANLSLAVQNALRFDEIESFNETLQQRVNEATRQLRHANERLKELNETKDDFIGMASHQLRTPLTTVKGYLSLVIEEDAGKINKTQKDLLTQAFVSSQRMVYLIADLLNVSRLRTGKFVIERAPTNIAEMISDEIGQLHEMASTRGLELTYKPPKNFPTLSLDETKTRQVVMNFIDNAIYYTPTGGHIRVEVKDLPKSVEFRVTDDGIGVPKDEHHHLFTKFYRAKNAQRARPDGTGLGLFMAKKVVVAQGGAMIFNSVEGEGSTFGFSFPKDMKTEEKQATVKPKLATSVSKT